jgi:putative Mg2+ transporter-C (MgtC) family protein
MEVLTAPASFMESVLRLALAAGLGAAVGANREFKQKPAGLRTHALVGLGAALLALVGLQMEAADDAQLNALSRVVQGIIVGVGFVGGGAILRRQNAREVEGLSTAASIWIVAATGVAAGGGLWRSALVAAGFALLILIAAPVDRAIRKAADDQSSS